MSNFNKPNSPLFNKTDFPIFANYPNISYLDNAATSQKPLQVINAISDYYQSKNANVHRGIHTLSELASEAYESARKRVGLFLNTNSNNILFTRNTSESVNLVANTWGMQNLKKGDVVLVTLAEHHSNFLPWVEVCKKTGATLRIADLNIDQENLANITHKDIISSISQNIDERVKVLAFPHASNVLGIIFPAHKLCKIAKDNNILTFIDGAQAIPNMKVDVHNLDCDFYAFSGHKMLGPTGIGVLYGKQKLLQDMPAYQVGGGMILDLEMSTLTPTWKAVPEKFEAGTPDIAGAIGLHAAIDYLTSFEPDEILIHERMLLDYLLQKLTENDFKGLTLIGNANTEIKTGLLSFYIKGLHAHDIAAVLNSEGVAVRSGHHCTIPLHKALNIPATVRASMYLYNTREDMDNLIKGLHKVYRILS